MTVRHIWLTFILFSATGFPAVLSAAEPSLLLDLRLDEGAGYVARDSSSSGNDATVHGGVWSSGRLGRGVELDGTTDHLSMAHRPAFDVDAFTVRMWVRLVQLPSEKNSGWLMLRHRGGDYYQISLRVETAGSRGYYARVENGGDRNSVTVLAPGPAKLGVWTHLATTFRQGALKLYVNGELVAQGRREGLSLPRLRESLLIGSGWGGFFQGAIDEVAWWAGALTDEEVRRDYEQALASERRLPPLPTRVWIEAEDLAGGWVRSIDRQRFMSCSGGRALYVPLSYRELPTESARRLMVPCATGLVDIPTNGTYHVWARVRAMGGHSERKVLIASVGGTQTQQPAVADDAWSWCCLGKVALEGGSGRVPLRLTGLCPGACCDALVLDMDPKGVPQGEEPPADTLTMGLRPWIDATPATDCIVVDPQLAAAVREVASGQGSADDLASVRKRMTAIRGIRCFWPEIVQSVWASAADIDGDGRYEAIGPIGRGKKTLACIDEQGKVRWRTRWPESRFPGMDDNLTRIVDLDGDGRHEFIIVDSTLSVFDAHTGRVKWQQELDQNPEVFERFYNKANLPWDVGHVSDKTRWDIVVGVDLEDGPGVQVYSVRGELIWSKAVPSLNRMRVEHELRCVDLDRDGLDEVLVTFTDAHVALDHNGEQLWLLRGAPLVRGHTDFWDAADVDGDGSLEVLYQAGDTAHLIDARSGRPKLSLPGAGGQRGFLRDFLLKVPGIEILVCENRLKMFDCRGRILWERRGLTGKQCCLGDWDGDGQLDILFCKYGKPHMAARGDDPDIQVYDAYGRLRYCLRWGFKHGGAPWYKAQRYHNAPDTDGDGLAEFLIGSYPSGPLCIMECGQ